MLQKLLSPLSNVILFIISVFLVAIILNGKCKSDKTTEEIKTETDTIVVTKIVKDTVLLPQIIETTRTEIVSLPSAEIDTVLIDMVVPITQKTYQTDDYKAVIEGYNPQLTLMEVYKKTEYINTTTTIQVKDTRKWSVNVRAGFSTKLNKDEVLGISPQVGLGLNYKIRDNLSLGTRYNISGTNSLSMNLHYTLFKF